jgi:hypothetical protein
LSARLKRQVNHQPASLRSFLSFLSSLHDGCRLLCGFADCFAGFQAIAFSFACFASAFSSAHIANMAPPPPVTVP